MKNIVIVSTLVLLAIIGGYVVYNTIYKKDPIKSDEAMNVFLVKCANNDNCKSGVKEHYLSCASNLSFDKPSKQSDMQEYFTLIKAEINECLVEKIGSDFPDS